MRWRGGVSVVVLLLTWAALDDITTDNANSFPFEYSLLVLSGIWFGSVAVYLLGRRRALAGVTSAAAVAVGVVAYWSLPHHHAPASWVNQLGLFPLAWFLVLTVRMIAFPRSAGSLPPSARPPIRTPVLRLGQGRTDQGPPQRGGPWRAMPAGIGVICAICAERPQRWSPRPRASAAWSPDAAPSGAFRPRQRKHSASRSP